MRKLRVILALIVTLLTPSYFYIGGWEFSKISIFAFTQFSLFQMFPFFSQAIVLGELALKFFLVLGVIVLIEKLLRVQNAFLVPIFFAVVFSFGMLQVYWNFDSWGRVEQAFAEVKKQSKDLTKDEALHILTKHGVGVDKKSCRLDFNSEVYLFHNCLEVPRTGGYKFSMIFDRGDKLIDMTFCNPDCFGSFRYISKDQLQTHFDSDAMFKLSSEEGDYTLYKNQDDYSINKPVEKR